MAVCPRTPALPLAATRHRPLFGLLLGCGLLAAAPPVAAGGLEAKVQAAYLFNFTKFVEWPESVGDPLTLCVVGAEAVGGILAELAARPSKGRALKIELGRPADPRRCQLLFIGQREAGLDELLERCRDAPVLTVSDAAGFARQGGVIGFYLAEGKIKLEINPERAHAANLKISARLMELARIAE